MHSGMKGQTYTQQEKVASSFSLINLLRQIADKLLLINADEKNGGE